MKRILLLFMLLVCASFVNAQSIVRSPSSVSSGSSSVIGGLNQGVCFDDAGVLNCAVSAFLYDKTNAVLDISNIGFVAGSTSAIKKFEASPSAPVAALAGAGAGNVNSGTHTYETTCVTPGGETTPSAASGIVTTTGGNGKVSLSSIAACSAIATDRKIYRTVAGNSGSYLLLTNLGDNTTTTYTDNTADSSLGAAAPATNSALDARETFSNNAITDVVFHVIPLGTASTPSLSFIGHPTWGLFASGSDVEIVVGSHYFSLTTSGTSQNGSFTAQDFSSTIGTGNPPFYVSSTTKVTNLNTDLLDGLDSTAFAQVLSGTSGSIGGGALAAGACASATMTITGATTSMVAFANPSSNDATLDSCIIKAYVSAADTVTVQVCESIVGTPAAKTYLVRVIK